MTTSGSFTPGPRYLPRPTPCAVKTHFQMRRSLSESGNASRRYGACDDHHAQLSNHDIFSSSIMDCTRRCWLSCGRRHSRFRKVPQGVVHADGKHHGVRCGLCACIADGTLQLRAITIRRRAAARRLAQSRPARYAALSLLPGCAFVWGGAFERNTRNAASARASRLADHVGQHQIHRRLWREHGRLLAVTIAKRHRAPPRAPCVCELAKRAAP